ncbi:MAG: IS110 family transposase, partial [Elusimicrobiota bacterium]
MLNTLIVGIDAHSKVNQGVFTDVQGNLVKSPFQFPNNLPSAQKLENSIVETATKNGFEEVKIGTEATSFYDLHLVDYLTASPKLKP